MHDTALRTGEAFFKCYGFFGCRILDVGSMDVNGSLRQFVPKGAAYLGVDLAPGPGVDRVIESAKFPFGNDAFDLVVSTSCLEHDPLFWLTFAEMCRVTRPDGFVYVSVPSNGPIHRHPIDCWRFYPDSAMALANWSTKVGDCHVDVIENFLMSPSADGWIDQVMVFGKRLARKCPALRDALL